MQMQPETTSASAVFIIYFLTLRGTTQEHMDKLSRGIVGNSTPHSGTWRQSISQDLMSLRKSYITIMQGIISFA